MTSPRLVYYDTETTGLKAERDRIVEIAAYDPLNERYFEALVNPGCPIPSEASAIHKITDEMVAAAPGFALVSQDFVEFCRGDVILIAHNNDNFDVHFLRHEFLRNELQMPEWKFLDSLKWARRYRADLPRHTLQFLREIYGIAANNAHRALDDVVVLHKIFQFMIDDIPVHEIYDLLYSRALSQVPPEVMPFGKHQGVSLDKVPKHYVKWMGENGVFEKPENEALKTAFMKLGFLQASPTPTL